jgi:hypothetical protein
VNEEVGTAHRLEAFADKVQQQTVSEIDAPYAFDIAAKTGTLREPPTRSLILGAGLWPVPEEESERAVMPPTLVCGTIVALRVRFSAQELEEVPPVHLDLTLDKILPLLWSNWWSSRENWEQCLKHDPVVNLIRDKVDESSFRSQGKKGVEVTSVLDPEEKPISVSTETREQSEEGEASGWHTRAAAVWNFGTRKAEDVIGWTRRSMGQLSRQIGKWTRGVPEPLEGVPGISELEPPQVSNSEPRGSRVEPECLRGCSEIEIAAFLSPDTLDPSNCEVEVNVTLDEEGEVAKMELLRSSCQDSGYNDAVLLALSTSHWSPA